MISLVSKNSLAQRLCYGESERFILRSELYIAAYVSQLMAFSKRLLKAVVSRARFFPWGLKISERSRIAVRVGAVARPWRFTVVIRRRVVYAAFHRQDQLFRCHIF